MGLSQLFSTSKPLNLLVNGEPEINNKNPIWFNGANIYVKKDKVLNKLFNLNTLNPLNSILKKLFFTFSSSSSVQNSSKPYSSKVQNYSLYCLSHRYCWEKEKHWYNFLYFYGAPSKLGDVPIYLYKQRLVDKDQVPLLGAKIIHTLLKDFHYDELKKMDKQNRISLYELTKTYELIKKSSNLNLNVNSSYTYNDNYMDHYNETDQYNDDTYDDDDRQYTGLPPYHKKKKSNIKKNSNNDNSYDEN